VGLRLFSARLEIPSGCDLLPLTMGRGKIEVLVRSAIAAENESLQRLLKLMISSQEDILRNETNFFKLDQPKGQKMRII